MHSASVASLIELLVVLGFGATKQLELSKSTTVGSRGFNASILPEVIQMEIGSLTQLLTGGGVYEMSYTISSLCSLVSWISDEWWIKNPFRYFELSSILRNVVLLQETHKWCALLPTITKALNHLLALEAPIRMSHPHCINF
ncbi:hypothetical protein EDC01DRAFT_413969 [Geopyxis carbonaria]|nr:hypothetical protein EDC01DRAFT_413969 [Geopyxis carbonaria]